MGSIVNVVTTRRELDAWLVDPAPPAKPPVVLLLRGDSQVVNAFKGDALTSASAFPHREAVWVKDTSLFTAAETKSFFNDDPKIIAVAFSIRHVPSAWVTSDEADLTGADDAFLHAEQAS